MHVWVRSMPARLHCHATLGSENATGEPALFEQMVDVFELQASSLGEEAIDDRNPACVEDLIRIN